MLSMVVSSSSTRALSRAHVASRLAIRDAKLDPDKTRGFFVVVELDELAAHFRFGFGFVFGFGLIFVFFYFDDFDFAFYFFYPEPFSCTENDLYYHECE